MLADIMVHAIEQEPDFRLIRETPASAASKEHAQVPDVVIIGGNAHDDPSPALELLAQWPTVRILSVANRGKRALLYELRPHKSELGELSPSRLAQTLRSAVRSTARALDWRELHQR